MASSYFKLKLLKARNKSLKLKNIEDRKNIFAQNKNNINTAHSHKCRICLLEGSLSIFTDIPENTLQSINFHGGIHIEKKDHLPKYICSSCYTILQNAILFRAKAQNSDKILRRKFNKNIPIDNLNIHDTTSDVNHESDIQSLESDGENTINQKQELSCKRCKLNFKNWNSFRVHKNTIHRKLHIQCSICNSVLTVNLFKKHLARHQSATHLVCEVCGKLYRKDNLVRHLQLHTFNLPYQCKICSYRGRFLESLKTHMQTHSNRKPFSCENCHLRFSTKSNLNRHILTHRKEKPFKCTECCRRFYTKRDLAKHLVDHTGIKEFVCNICNSKYCSRKSLMRHELKVHKREKMARGRTPLYLQPEYKEQSLET